jgi:hypothetical protein
MDLLTLLIGVVIVMAIPIWGVPALLQGIAYRPRTTLILVIVFVLAVLFAGASYRHFFPGCSGSVWAPGVTRC